ncbi:hypothetical protein [Amphritea balenae]|uniref:Uncharacterized protein n=1 Tax=Amphritea balenae TaxID=452629 RepID=A0A3P1SI51_9GAMM|nr:hypothetical protein [Amphritea balenae]RRC96828.1 hypothetical protein EHS89_19940 [Amphritea balenae]GGK61412.1 hypothetical protein GCM10007941_09480 [Amphritea balenae]
MGFELLKFLVRLILPDWMQNREPDRAHFYRRKFTGAYRARKQLVTLLWCGSGLLMLLIPVPAFIITTALFTTFISFSLLDEAG